MEPPSVGAPMQHSPVAFLAAVALATARIDAQPSTPAGGSPTILQRPAISRTMIAFEYGGDLWVVPRAGGEVRRLTAGGGRETDPVFSPDGSLIAFTGDYDGNTDVYVVPTAGGMPKRLTHHPGEDAALGWMPDGKHVLFRSGRRAI